MHEKERKIRELWQLCFHDDERFVELLFGRLYRDEGALIVEENGVAISALQVLPYQLNVGESLLDVGYISGAATHPDYRNRGWMGRLLKEAFEWMFTRHIPLSALIPAEPWLFDYYTLKGYAPVFFRQEQHYTDVHRFNREGYHRITSTWDELYRFMDAQLKRRPCCVQHSRADFEVICGDVELEGGAVVALGDECDTLSAMAFVVPYHDTVVVKELLALDAQAYEALLGEIQSLFPNRPMTVHTPPVESLGVLVRRGMIRIIDVDEVLSLFAGHHHNLRVSFRVTDPLLPGNNGDYWIEKGSCVRTAVERPDYEIDITELSEILFGGEEVATLLDFPSLRPYMSLMLD